MQKGPEIVLEVIENLFGTFRIEKSETLKIGAFCPLWPEKTAYERITKKKRQKKLVCS